MIAVGGEALVDLVIDPAGGVVAALGGGPFNVARAVSRLGEQCRFLGALSTDRFGSSMRLRLQDDGVDVACTTSTDLPTTLAVAELDESGAASYRFYFQGTSAPTFAPETGDNEVLADSSALHVGTLGLVFEPMATTLAALVARAPEEVLVVVDPNCRPSAISDRSRYLARLHDVLRRADVVKASTDDLDYLAPGTSAPEAARGLLRFGPAVVLITAGGGDVIVMTVREELTVPVPSVEVADTIGAGDAFSGAFVAWWVASGLGRDELRRGDALRDATAAAVVVAAKTCERTGANPPRLDELPSDWKPPIQA
jgi:fructokinase